MEKKTIDIVTCSINPLKEAFVIQYRMDDDTYETEVKTLKDFNILDKNDREFLLLANRHYISDMFARDRNKSMYDGLLPLGCLIKPNESDCGSSLSVQADVCISPKYLLNCFINLMELLFKDNSSSPLDFFDRDEKVLIPASDERMQEMMKAMLAKQSTAVSQSTQSDNGGGGTVDQLATFLSIVMGQMKKVEEVLSKKMENIQSSQRLKRSTNIIGGINFQHGGNDEDKRRYVFSDMITDLGESRDQIHSFIRENSQYIVNECLRLECNGDYGNNALKEVMDILQQDAPSKTPIYHNQRITYPLMFRTLGQVFEVVFMKLLPRVSMALCMIGSVYYATFLNEIKSFESYSYQLQLPLILRIIYACYPDDINVSSIPNSEIYMANNYPSLYKDIQNVQKNGMIAGGGGGGVDDTLRENNLAFITKAAMKFHFEDKDFSDHLYNVLNAKRRRVYEYYIIAMLSLYLNGIAISQGITKKVNRESNGKQFIAPIHRVLTELFEFSNIPDVKQTIMDNVGFIKYEYIQQFLDSFHQTKSNVLEKCMKDTITVLGGIIGEHVTE